MDGAPTSLVQDFPLDEDSYGDVVPPLPFWDEGLQWWMLPATLLRGIPIHEPLPDHLIYADASTTGWGALWDLRSFSRTWSPQQAADHVDVLELEPVFLALHAFRAGLRSSAIQIHSDDSIAVASLSEGGGGAHSKVLHRVATKIFNLCAEHGCWLSTSRAS